MMGCENKNTAMLIENRGEPYYEEKWINGIAVNPEKWKASYAIVGNEYAVSIVIWLDYIYLLDRIHYLEKRVEELEKKQPK